MTWVSNKQVTEVTRFKKHKRQNGVYIDIYPDKYVTYITYSACFIMSLHSKDGRALSHRSTRCNSLLCSVCKPRQLERSPFRARLANSCLLQFKLDYVVRLLAELGGLPKPAEMPLKCRRPNDTRGNVGEDLLCYSEWRPLMEGAQRRGNL